MNSHKVHPKVWIAPAHTFDKQTIIALKKETEIKIISDGTSIFPFKKGNMIFIPQQLWPKELQEYGLFACIQIILMLNLKIWRKSYEEFF